MASFAPFELVFILVILLLPLIALVDIVRSRFQDSINKIVWVLIVIMVPALGTFLYFILGSRQKLKA
jgi:heme/copper-type cytochrome/quinol oxidase subunit 2